LEEAGGQRQIFGRVINKIPSLGLGYLAAVAEKNKHKVKIIDCNLGIHDNHLIETAREFNPEIIGITATTPVFRNAIRTASILRSIFPEAVLICGGAHPSADPQSAIGAGVFDFLVLGEGEETFLELISYLENKSKIEPEDIQGLAFLRKGKIFITQKRLSIADLDSLPFPARYLFAPLSVYRPTPASYRKLPLGIMMTSRGCPSQCTFCDRQVFGEKFRQRSVDNVMAEIEELLSRYGVREIRFFDDTFTVNHVFVEDLCRKIKKIRIPWTCLTKVTAVNPGMLKMMRQAGCWQVLFGLESGDNFVLSKLAKGNTVERNREAVYWARKAGLSVRADFLVGSPWETKRSFQRTVGFAKSLPLDFAHFNKFVPFSGTFIYKKLVNQGHKFHFNDGAYINNHSDFVYLPDGFDKNEYEALLNQAYKEFYLRPSYFLQRILAVRTITELSGQMQGLVSILHL
jgi:radical SAM superfamily enzyme YgiQ (UPF0313 family)